MGAGLTRTTGGALGFLTRLPGCGASSGPQCQGLRSSVGKRLRAEGRVCGAGGRGAVASGS